MVNEWNFKNQPIQLSDAIWPPLIEKELQEIDFKVAKKANTCN